MKRLIILLAFILPLSFASNAQIKFGVKGGLTSTSIKTDDLIDAAGSDAGFDQLVIKGKNSKVGFQAGIFSRITIAKIYIQPELLFTSTSGEVEVTTITGDNSVSEIREQKFRQIDFPIMLGYKAGPLRLQAGPVGTIMLSTDPALDMFDDVNVKEEFNGATWGYQVGIGFDILKKVTIDIKYEGNLSKLADGVKIGDDTLDFDSRNSQFVASLGFFF
ncbi:MAG: PorT family protein [Bacteroidales bacterium]|jgi:hypothetical protein|nr:PorT family protein [Bacteroidales bacterium]